MKVTVKARWTYDHHKKRKFTLNIKEDAVLRNALRYYYNEVFTQYDRGKDVENDAGYLARCKVIKHLLKKHKGQI